MTARSLPSQLIGLLGWLLVAFAGAAIGAIASVEAASFYAKLSRQADAKQMISIVAKEIKGVYRLLEKNDQYFGIESLDEVVMSHEAMFVFTWRHRSGLKSPNFRSSHGLKPLGVKRASKAA